MNIPLKEQLEMAETASTGPPDMKMPVPAFFASAAVLSGTQYMKWLYGQLKAMYNIQPEFTYREMTAHAKKLWSGDLYCQDGCDLFYQLIIEPFALIELNRKETSE